MGILSQNRSFPPPSPSPIHTETTREPHFGEFKSHNSIASGRIYLVIKLSLHFMLINIFIKFDGAQF